MKTIYYTATSLDGYIATADHSLDWLFQFGDGGGQGWNEFIGGVGAIAMGSHTYEWVLRNHVYADPDRPKPFPNEHPTWVFTSRELERPPGADVRFARGDVAAAHAEMREVAAGRNVWLAGGGALAAAFHEAGLLDELILFVAPVLLGAGAPLFAGSIVKPPLEVASVRPMDNGLTEFRLEVRRGAAV